MAGDREEAAASLVSFSPSLSLMWAVTGDCSGPSRGLGAILAFLWDFLSSLQ